MAWITGAIWFVKSQADAVKDVVLTVDTRSEQLILEFPAGQARGVQAGTRRN